MSLHHSTYLTFTGDAAEALNYYQSVFGGELTITTYGDFSNLDDYPFEPDPTWVAHGELRGTVNLSGGDGGDQALESDSYSMLLHSTETEEGRAILARLADDGGTVIMPFERAPWGDHYGQTRDRFGVLWAVAVAHS